MQISNIRFSVLSNYDFLIPQFSMTGGVRCYTDLEKTKVSFANLVIFNTEWISGNVDQKTQFSLLES